MKMKKETVVRNLLFKVIIVIAFSYFAVALNGNFHHHSLNNVVTTQAIIAGDVFFEITEPYALEYTYRLRPAKDFGTSFSKRMEGVALIFTNPLHACNKIVNSNALHGNVAFIERGQCSFVTKALNAEIAGAVAVIVTEFNNNSTEFDYYIEMVNDNSGHDVHIPAGFLLGRNGIVIRNTLLRQKRSFAVINLPVNLTFTPPSKINHPPWLDW